MLFVKRNIWAFVLLLFACNSFGIIPQKPKKLEVGSVIPMFELKDQYGEMFSLDSVLYKKNLVVFFYPKDDTPGCTKQACTFRDQYEVFVKENAVLVGISGQSVESHLAFAQKYNLNYSLLSDEGNKLRKLFGVPADMLGMVPGRVTYVINKRGEVVYIFNSQTQVEKHVTEALRILRGLN